MKSFLSQTKQWLYFVGIDVSKDSWDLTILSASDLNTKHHIKTDNSHDGWDKVLCWLDDKNVSLKQTLFCLESTGVYAHTLLACLSAYNADTWVENALRIKRSSGIIRGKNDKQDAFMIAHYARRHHDIARLYIPNPQTLERLKELMRLRENLIKTKNNLIKTINEMSQMGVPIANELRLYLKATLAGIDKDLDKIELKINTIIKDDDELNELHQIITSVVGVGTRTAIALIVFTNRFSKFNSPRQLACYCGVVPFQHQSGSSVKGKDKLSKMCNHQLKALLHLAALSAVRHDPEIKEFYERKKAEGKNTMAVLNAVRNKLVHRIFAVVKRMEPYEKYNYLKTA